jgi:hypothetical protein
MRNIPTEVVCTVVSFDTDASYPKLQFDFGGLLTEETQKLVDPLFGSAQIVEIIGAASTPGTVSPVTTPVEAVAAPVVEPPAPAPAPVTPSPEPVADKQATGFGSATVVAGAEAPKEEAAEEPTAAPAAEGTAGLAAEITQLMTEVADDA